jgi:hypothetical protein
MVRPKKYANRVFSSSTEAAQSSPWTDMTSQFGDRSRGLRAANPVAIGLPNLNPAQARYLGEKFTTLDADARFQRSIQAIHRLRRDIVKDVPFDSIFSLYAFLIVTKWPSRKLMEKFWSYGTGKTWKSLCDFPMRLRRMAEEVKQVQAAPHFAPDSSIYGQSPLAKNIKHRIRELPLNLDVFAKHIEVILERLRKTHVSKSSLKRKFREPWASQLSELVNALTTGYRDKEVAELLNSAAAALNEDFAVDALALAQARSKRKKKHPAPS